MLTRKIALLAALAACSFPAAANDLLSAPNTTLFYFSLPLDGAARKESAPSFGFAINGRQPYQTLRVDSRMFSNFAEVGLLGLELKWLVAGGAVAAATVAMASQDKSVTQQQSQQAAAVAAQQEAQQNPVTPAPCPQVCPPAWRWR
jgi:hypothetical protein